MKDHKLKALRKLLDLMKTRQTKKLSPYSEGAKLSGMAGYLPDMKDGGNMELQRKKLQKAKPYDRIEKDK
jgi:hypothetical protein